MGSHELLPVWLRLHLTTLICITQPSQHPHPSNVKAVCPKPPIKSTAGAWVEPDISLSLQVKVIYAYLHAGTPQIILIATLLGALNSAHE